MASRAVVFRPINADDVSCTPFEANTTFKVIGAATGSYVIRHGIHNNQITPISASNLSADNIKNPDGTFQTPTWKLIDHFFYRPENKHQPMNTMEHWNPRYTEKQLSYSCSIISIPYIYHGERIKKQSIVLHSTGSYRFDRFRAYDDKYGNLRDHTIDSASFAPTTNLVGYWGFNDEFRNFEMNFGYLGKDTRDKTTIRVTQPLVNQKFEYNTWAKRVQYEPGITTRGQELLYARTGSQLIANYDFLNWTNDNPTNWTTTEYEGSSSIHSGSNANSVIMSHSLAGGGGNATVLTQNDVLTVGKLYRYEISASFADMDGVYIYQSSGKNVGKIGAKNTNGIFSGSFTARKGTSPANGRKFMISRNSTGSVDIDYVKVHEIIRDNSGICATFKDGEQAYIKTENHDKFNFRNDDSYAISFWLKLPPQQAYTGSGDKVTSNAIITKRGVEKELVRINRKSNRRTMFRETNLKRTRYPFDISVTNESHPTYPPGKLLFRRSDGILTTEVTTSMCLTSSADGTHNHYGTGSHWHHVVCQKSGSNMQIWVDGTMDVTLPSPWHYDEDLNTQNPSFLMFGALNTDTEPSASEAFSGSLDEIRIYDTWLESGSIQSLANNHYISSSAYQTSVCGNVFYRSGQAVITSQLPKYQYALQEHFSFEHKSSRTIYENEVLCRVPMGECNVSMNPTLRKIGSEIIQPQFTGSGFKPYITTVGLYDDQAQLLAVAKLGRPIQKREDIDMNFLIRWDY